VDEDRQAFEQVVQEEFDRLPDKFRYAIENVHIVVDGGDGGGRRRGGTRSGSALLGLYEGIPLTKRGADYGVYPVVPDRITLFQKSITSTAGPDEEVRRLVRMVLIHEIGHYFGMSEAELRAAGY